MIQKYLSKMSKQEKLLVSIAAGFLFLAFMDQAVLGPIKSKMKVLDANIRATSQLVKRNNQILSFRSSIIKDYSKYNSYLTPLGRDDQELIAEQLHAIESMANQRSITIANIKAGDITENPVSKELQISMDCEGTLANVLDFMASMENSNYLFQIQKYSFTPKSKTSDLIKSTMEVLRTVIFKDEDEPAPGISRMEAVAAQVPGAGAPDVEGKIPKTSSPDASQGDVKQSDAQAAAPAPADNKLPEAPSVETAQKEAPK